MTDFLNKDGVEIAEHMTKGYTNIKLSNIECHWLHLDEPDTAFGNNKWCLEMRLDDGIAQQLRDIGFIVKDKIDLSTQEVKGKNVLKAKKEVVTQKGKVQMKPSVVGPDGKTPWTEPMGNGTICNLHLSFKAWFVNGVWQMSMYIDAVQVVTLAAFAGSFSDVSGDDEQDVPF